MKHVKIDTATNGHEFYEGLSWTGSSKSNRKAHSPTTRSTYFVEPGAGSLWSVRHGFSDAPGKPNMLIGQYADQDVALVAAERHDFRYWKSSAERAGIDPVFVGSQGAVADFVAALPEHEREDATEMLIAEYTLSDGRPFSAAASFFSATKTGLKQERSGKYTLTLTVDAEAVPLWMMQTGIGTELTIGAVETGKTEDDEWIERGKNAIRRAAVLPADNSFQGWILQRYDRWGLVKTAMAQTTDDVEAAVAETLRRIIGAPSRRTLATNRDAIMRIERLDREFYLDLSRGLGAENP
jgi:hypothetical protein